MTFLCLSINRGDQENLFLSFSSKNTSHDQEIQKLYEEMEYQIKQEKEKILTEVRERWKGISEARE